MLESSGQGHICFIARSIVLFLEYQRKKTEPVWLWRRALIGNAEVSEVLGVLGVADISSPYCTKISTVPRGDGRLLATLRSHELHDRLRGVDVTGSTSLHALSVRTADVALRGRKNTYEQRHDTKMNAEQ